MTLEEQLIMHEGLKVKPYKDTAGKLTIGVGRNLDDTGITHLEAMTLLANDLERIREGLNNALPYFADLSEIRQRVLIDMAFNLGVRGLLGFRMTLLRIEQGRYAEAADHMLESKWAGQVGQRARRLSYMIRHDKEMP